MNMLEPMLHRLLHLVLSLLGPPLLLGVINKTKALMAGRKGPPLVQPYADLVKLLGKGSVFSTTTSWVFRAGPIIGLSTTLLALLFVPMGGLKPQASFSGDFFLVVYLLALGRFFTVIAALDTGSAFEGMGAAREAAFACLAEPALLLALLVMAAGVPSASLASVLGSWLSAKWATEAAALVLVLVALFIVLLAENSRIPFDDPNTHLELTMIHEVMVLDHSGPAFAAILYGAALKLYLFSALVVSLAVPSSLFNGWTSLGVFWLGLLFVAVLVGLVESLVARLRLPQVPSLLAGACLLSGLAVVLVSR